MDYKARFYSSYINRFLQPDSIIPGAGNPQAFNRYSYVGNRPVNFNDPSGHMPIAGCGDDGKDDCYEDDPVIRNDNAAKLALLEGEAGDRKCAKGNKNYCSTAKEHPVELATFVVGSVFVAGAAETVIMASAIEALQAIVINAVLSVTIDAAYTIASGNEYTVEQGIKTAAFSIAMGQASAGVASLAGDSFWGNLGGQTALQVVGNTMYRRANGRSTTLLGLATDIGSAGMSVSFQNIPGIDLYIASHVSEGLSGIYGGISESPWGGTTLNSVKVLPGQ